MCFLPAAEGRDYKMLIERLQRRIFCYMSPLLISSLLLGAFIRDGYCMTTEEEKKIGKKVIKKRPLIILFSALIMIYIKSLTEYVLTNS
jgi:hypothetical protein